MKARIDLQDTHSGLLSLFKMFEITLVLITFVVIISSPTKLKTGTYKFLFFTHYKAIFLMTLTFTTVLFFHLTLGSLHMKHMSIIIRQRHKLTGFFFSVSLQNTFSKSRDLEKTGHLRLTSVFSRYYIKYPTPQQYCSQIN